MKEIEAKFLVRDLAAYQRKILRLGARCVRERMHERNVRFDTPEQGLAGRLQVLRLRRDDRILLTYKAPGAGDERMERVEIEVQVSDFTRMRALLEALGYQVSLEYEKFRTNLLFGDVHISLDETPLGAFVEIEGPHGLEIKEAAGRSGLEWSNRITDSYAELFNKASRSLGLAFRDLTFDNFAGLEVPPAAMGVSPADMVGGG